MESEIILELTSADIPGALDALAGNGVEILQIQRVTDLTIRFLINRKYLLTVQSAVQRRGETLREIRRLGIFWKMRMLSRHWLLVAGIIGLVLLTSWLPNRVLFICVEGNTQIPARMILEKAAQCGIVFGADRGAVRSEHMKNALLEAVPELQWAGINTTGCTAVITVRERSQPSQTEADLPGSMVAVRDGIILEVTAQDGTALVQPGRAVRAGEVLISGYTDCGGVILLSGAKGEVYAQTRHLISAITLPDYMLREEKLGQFEKISLVIGKNRINFYEDSGILDAGCVKMYSEYYLTLPGGFVLPVKLVLEREIRYECVDAETDPQILEGSLREETEAYLLDQMIAGSILSVSSRTEGCVYSAEYVCREMIGRQIYEEIIEDYGENR